MLQYNSLKIVNNKIEAIQLVFIVIIIQWIVSATDKAGLPKQIKGHMHSVVLRS